MLVIEGAPATLWLVASFALFALALQRGPDAPKTAYVYGAVLILGGAAWLAFAPWNLDGNLRGCMAAYFLGRAVVAIRKPLRRKKRLAQVHAFEASALRRFDALRDEHERTTATAAGGPN